MSPANLLDYALDSTKYFLNNPSLSATYPSLNGYTLEDVAMESVTKILESKVEPQTKTYITEMVRTTFLDLLKKRKITYVDSKAQDTRESFLFSVEDLEESLWDSLDSEDQDLYLLYAVQGESEEVIATHYNVSPRTIRRRVAELRENIICLT